MIAKSVLASLVVSLVLALPTVAAADGYGGGPANLRRLVMYQGQIEVDLDLHINLTDEFEGEPIALSPSVYYGFTDQISAGIAHNPYPALGLFGGAGLCFNECGNAYNNLSLDFLYLLLPSETFQLAFRGGLDFLRFDPEVDFQVRAGVRGRFTAGRFALVFEPSFSVGDAAIFGNEVALHVPGWLLFQVTPALALGGLVGFNTNFDDGNVFLGFPLLYTPNPNLDFGFLFVFPFLSDTGAIRSVTFQVAFRF